MYIKSSLASKTRVLVVENSALARKLLTSGLSADPRIEVVGTAGDPKSAINLILKLHPNVMTLNVEMPGMDGVSFLKNIMPVCPIPTVAFITAAEKSKKLGLDALEAGAVDVIVNSGEGYEGTGSPLMKDICNRVVSASKMNVSHFKQKGDYPKKKIDLIQFILRPSPKSHSKEKNGQKISPYAFHENTGQVIAIGASAGGVAILSQIIPLFPADTPGIVIVQQLPIGFTGSFVNRLNTLSVMQVKEAENGDLVRPGLILMAPAGENHLEVRLIGAEYRVVLLPGEKVSDHRPAVDVLFHSLAKHVGQNAAAALLTAVDEDGTEGLLAIRNAGGRTFTQDEPINLTFDVPDTATNRWESEILLPLKNIPAQLLRAANG